MRIVAGVGTSTTNALFDSTGEHRIGRELVRVTQECAYRGVPVTDGFIAAALGISTSTVLLARRIEYVVSDAVTELAEQLTTIEHSLPRSQVTVTSGPSPAIRGAIDWPRTLAGRGRSSFGLEEYWCSWNLRTWDGPEARVLVAQLQAIRATGVALARSGLAGYGTAGPRSSALAGSGLAGSGLAAAGSNVTGAGRSATVPPGICELVAGRASMAQQALRRPTLRGLRADHSTANLAATRRAGTFAAVLLRAESARRSKPSPRALGWVMSTEQLAQLEPADADRTLELPVVTVRRTP